MADLISGYGAPFPGEYALWLTEEELTQLRHHVSFSERHYVMRENRILAAKLEKVLHSPRNRDG